MATPGEIWINNSGKSLSVVDSTGVVHVLTGAVGTPPTPLATGEMYLHNNTGFLGVPEIWFKDSLGNSCVISFELGTTAGVPVGSLYVSGTTLNAVVIPGTLSSLTL